MPNFCLVWAIFRSSKSKSISIGSFGVFPDKETTVSGISITETAVEILTLHAIVYRVSEFQLHNYLVVLSVDFLKTQLLV